jgi:hypothetical protein
MPIYRLKCFRDIILWLSPMIIQEERAEKEKKEIVLLNYIINGNIIIHSARVDSKC